MGVRAMPQSKFSKGDRLLIGHGCGALMALGIQKREISVAHQTIRIGVCATAFPTVSFKTMSPICTQQCAANGSRVTPNTMFAAICRRERNLVSASESRRQDMVTGRYSRAHRKDSAALPMIFGANVVVWGGGFPACFRR